jgi:hypothetical protein
MKENDPEVPDRQTYMGDRHQVKRIVVKPGAGSRCKNIIIVPSTGSLCAARPA